MDGLPRHLQASDTQKPKVQRRLSDDPMLSVCLVLHLICIALVAFALCKSSWHAGSLWIYALLVVLPYIFGTTSAIWVDSIIENLSRITPFLLCASDSGALASRSIFQQCFPVPSNRIQAQQGPEVPAGDEEEAGETA